MALVGPRLYLHRLASERPALLEMLPAVLAFLLALGFYHYHSVDVVGASDSYGYLSEALRLLKGHFYEPEQVLSPFGVPENSYLSYPLGYIPYGREGTVPTYPFGYPLLMLPLLLLAGIPGAFWVSPLLGAGGVALVYRLGRTWLGWPGGAIAALLLAVFPTYVWGATEALSDVPATFFAALALWALLRREPSRHHDLLLGVALGMGIWVRPNLVLLVVAIAAWLLWQRSWRRLAWAGLALAPFVLVEAAVNTRLYGAAWASGYGKLPWAPTYREAAERGLRHLGRLQEQQLGIGLLLVALGLLFGRLRFSTRLFLVGTAVLFLAFFSYYAIDDAWTYGRFLLPALPGLVLLEASLLVRVIDAGRFLPQRRGALLAGLLVFGAASLAYSQEHHVFGMAAGEHRYTNSAAMARQHVQSPALVIAMVHSGSLRLYGGLPTIRYDVAPLADLLTALRQVEQAGGSVYILADDWELERYFSGRDRAILLEGAEEVAYLPPSVRLLRPQIPADPRSLAPQHVTATSLGGQIGLRGFDLSSSQLRPVESLTVTLYWHALARPSADYSITVQLLDEEGKLVAQADSYPLNGRYPTSLWSPGYVVPDQHTLVVPSLGHPATLTLIAAVYRPDTLERLPVTDASGAAQGDRVVLGTVEVD